MNRPERFGSEESADDVLPAPARSATFPVEAGGIYALRVLLLGDGRGLIAGAAALRAEFSDSDGFVIPPEYDRLVAAAADARTIPVEVYSRRSESALDAADYTATRLLVAPPRAVRRHDRARRGGGMRVAPHRARADRLRRPARRRGRECACRGVRGEDRPAARRPAELRRGFSAGRRPAAAAAGSDRGHRAGVVRVRLERASQGRSGAARHGSDREASPARLARERFRLHRQRAPLP